ncbi:RNA-directed DNA polymerase, eukaryota, reverse transcriptase zinc-binding domain protein [Tanacetum coccineum]
MINIYGPQDSLARAILWNRIGHFMHQHAGKYIIFGDKSGFLFSRQDADNFNSFIENSGLTDLDLPLGGRLFTWINKARTKLSKHNRFLISDEVAQSLPDVRVTAIDRLWSDHNTILLHVSKSNFGPTPFKLFYSWLLCDSFDESIEEKIEASSANDDDRDYILDTFESFDLFKRHVPNGISMEEFLNLYKEKFKEHDSNVDFLSFSNCSGLCALERDSLEIIVSLEEVKNAV